jgi:hypothetical protein
MAMTTEIAQFIFIFVSLATILDGSALVLDRTILVLI